MLVGCCKNQRKNACKPIATAAQCQRQKREGTDKIESAEYMFHGLSLFLVSCLVWI
jgi:hypothetical protein